MSALCQKQTLVREFKMSAKELAAHLTTPNGVAVESIQIQPKIAARKASGIAM